MEFSTALHLSFVSPKRPYLPRPLSAGKWALVTVVVLLSVPSTSVAQGNASAWSDGERRLRKAVHCPGQVISRALRYGTLPARSVLECASHCRADQRCLSIVFDDDVKECFLGNETSRQDCSNMEPGHGGLKHYETVCKEGEKLDPGSGQVCVCSEGFRGDPCASYVGDCAEGFNTGLFPDNGVYLIQPLRASRPFAVYCKEKSNARTYILDRRNDAVNFNRNFSEYQAGFGELDGNHWLGLDKVHQLSTSKRYELRITAKLQNGSNLFMQYQQFTISDADSGYRLYFNQTKLNETYLLGDCFSALYGAQFSTFDHDRDEADDVNCAARHGGGWWFRGSECSTCNPTGSLTMSEDVYRRGNDTEVFWTKDLGDLAIRKLSMFFVVLE